LEIQKWLFNRLRVYPSKNVVGQNFSLFIIVTLENQGTQTETFDVTVYCNSTFIGSETVALTSGSFKNVTFTWNTSSLAKGNNYTISAYAWPVIGETDTADNTLTDGWVVVTIPGDASGDGWVETGDFSLLCGAWNTKWGDPLYDGRCDFNNDGRIETADFSILCGNWGKSDP
jgi:hypothetical protein